MSNTEQTDSGFVGDAIRWTMAAQHARAIAGHLQTMRPQPEDALTKLVDDLLADEDLDNANAMCEVLHVLTDFMAQHFDIRPL